MKKELRDLNTNLGQIIQQDSDLDEPTQKIELLISDIVAQKW